MEINWTNCRIFHRVWYLKHMTLKLVIWNMFSTISPFMWNVSKQKTFLHKFYYYKKYTFLISPKTTIKTLRNCYLETVLTSNCCTLSALYWKGSRVKTWVKTSFHVVGQLHVLIATYLFIWILTRSEMSLECENLAPPKSRLRWKSHVLYS